MDTNKNLLLSFCFLLFTLLTGCNRDDNNMTALLEYDSTLINEVFYHAFSQYRLAIHYVDSINEYNQNLVSPIGVDNSTGELVIGNAYSWRCGFFPGSLWMLYYKTKDDFWKDNAIKHTEALQSSCTTSVHDLGFMFNNSYGKAYRISRDKKWLGVLRKAGETLASRFNSTVGCIRSWGAVDDIKSFTVIIDNMMNLELLFEMTKITGDSTYYEMAYSHAKKTKQNHFRSNYSSYHVVEYDQCNGTVVSKHTSQGYSDDSYWSRGQAWGLYGFTMCYRYTKDIDMLNQAKHIADFLLGLQYADDMIPYWDMLSPDIPNTVRDASAGAIMASALIELSSYCDGRDKSRYLTYAIGLIDNLHTKYESAFGENYGFLLLHSTQNYKQNDMVDTPLIYADYYYLEAVLRLLHLGNLEQYLEES